MHLNSIRPDFVGSLLGNGEPCAQARFVTSTERIKSSITGQGGVVGAGMCGKVVGNNVESGRRRKARKGFGGRSQSAHSSDEASNDRGAKWRRKVNR
jgi:hypothetical protein